MKLLDKYNFSVKLLCLLMLFYVTITSAQPVLPQRAITVHASQKLNFGLFYDKSGYGGSISVDPQGTRTVTGGIAILPSYPGQPALFEIKLCQGRSITISYPLETTLTSTGGAEIIMKIGPTQKGGNVAIFATENNCNFITILRVGATLHIPQNTHKGFYTGGFAISFDQQ